MLTTALLLTVGLVAILGIARYNRSTKLAWALATGLLLGIAGGSICAKAATPCNYGKNANLYQSVPMQGSIHQITLEALPQVIDDIDIQASDAKPVGSALSASPTVFAYYPTSIESFPTNKNVGSMARIAMNLFDTS